MTPEIFVLEKLTLVKVFPVKGLSTIRVLSGPSVSG